MLIRWIKRGTVLAVLFCGVFAAYFYHWLGAPNHQSENKIIEIRSGQGLSQIAHRLANESLIDSVDLFKIAVVLQGKDDSLRAGEFAVPARATPNDIITLLSSGPMVQHSMTIVEGITVHQALNLIRENPFLSGEVTLPVKEGRLAPETYFFTKGMPRDQLVKRMMRSQEMILAEIWEKRPKDTPLQSPEELLILASIVEKETAIVDEMPIVAAVFLNRLRINMPLQTDPTVIYAVTLGHENLGRRLSRKDLAIDSPFNTYANRGLPPTPIALPSIKAIEAVVNPANVDYLYFVADGTGGHVFAKTLAEHQKNHQKWRKIRKKREEEKSNLRKI